MKEGFSCLIEELCTYEDEYFDLFFIESFSIIKVEPVPLIKNMPDKLVNDEFATALCANDEYHRKRIEREGRG